MFTSSPAARTWSTPPKPMSYAQPSPPKIHTDFFERYSRFSRMSFLASQSQSKPSRAATRAFVAAVFFEPSSRVARYSLAASTTFAGALQLATIDST